MKTKTELLAELEQAQKRIAELENTITNSKKAVEKTLTVEELHTSKKWFTTLFRSNPIPVGITRKTDFRIVDVNDAWITMTGYSREEALGRTSTELGLAKPQTLQQIRDRLKTHGEIRQNEILLYTRSGQERHVLVSSEQIEIDGETYFLNNLLDVTESRLIEQKIHESEARFATVFFTNPAPQSILSLITGQVLEVNEATCQLFGYNREEIIGVDPGILNLWADPAEQVAALEELQTSDRLPPRVITIRKKSGETRSIIFSAEQITWKAEPCLITSSLDITERKLAEKNLRESEHRYTTLFQKSSISVFVLKLPEVVIADVNEGAEKLTGYSREELLGKTAAELGLISKSQRTEAIAKFERDKSLADNEMQIATKSGEKRVILISTNPIEINGQPFAFTSMQDITERKRAEQALIESNEKYRLLSEELEERVNQRTAEVQDLYDNAPAGYHSLDANGYFIQINQTELNWLGYTRNEVIGRPFTDFLTDKGLAIFKENFSAFKQHGWLQDLEIELLQKNGTILLALVNATAIKDKNGNYIMSRSTVFDITARKQAEQALRESEASLQNFLDTAHDLIQSLDDHGKFIYVNNAWCAALGYSLEEALHLSMFDVIAPEHHAICREMLNQLVVGKEPERVEVIFKTKQGQSVVVEGHVNSRKNANGQIATNGIFRDITLRKQADEALKASETKYRHLFENMNEGFSLQEIITDENGQPIDFRYLDANSMFEHHAGIAPQKVIGKTAREVFSQIDPRSIQNYGKVALTGEPISLEYFSTSVNRYMSVRAFSPKHGQFATIFEDITERKQAEDKLNESYARLDIANHELERASRAKDEFLANMSHELRTPLNAIIGLSDSMLEISFNDFTPRQQKYLYTIRESGQHLLEMINDILDLAKVGAGQLVLETHAVDLDTVCQASLRMIKQLAAHKNIDVHFDIDQNIYSINADERRLKQMLVNLLNNAVKFTPSTGEIGLEVRGDHTNKQVRFTVWDTGIGISKEDQTHLFQPFMQVNSSLSREVGGTGLGLALVSEMARLHGGTVSLESEPGKGSRFSFTLPWSDSEAIVSPQKTGSTGGLSLPPTTIHDKKLTILLVEDTETSVMAARDYLEAKGYLVEVARNGQDGIALARKIKPDLILMDVQMPELDGLEAMRRLRAQSEFQHTPIIALTAYAMQEDRDRCLAAGATDYMSKPYKLSLLVQKIEHLLKDEKK